MLLRLEAQQADQLAAYDENYYFLDAGSLNAPKDNVWHHLLGFSPLTGELVSEKPCPRLGILQPPTTPNDPLVFLGDNRQFAPTALVTDLLSGKERNFGLYGGDSRLLACAKNKNKLLIQQERQGVLLDLATGEQAILPIDFRALSAACFVAKDQTLALLFSPDPFRQTQGYFLLWHLQQQKVIYEEKLNLKQQAKLYGPEEFLGVLSKEYQVSLFDLAQCAWAGNFKALAPARPLSEKTR